MVRKRKRNRVQELIETGADLAGAAIGGALGFLAAGPVGAAGAGAVGVVIAKGANKLLGDLANRKMSYLETERIGATAAIALNTIKERLEAGDSPRNDGFFDKSTGERSSADEILEGTLQKSKNEHEMKKIEFLGKFFANLSFAPSVSAGEANHYLNIINNLSYRQICILNLILAKTTLSGINLRRQDYTQATGINYETVSLLQEVFSLYNNGLIVCKDLDGKNYLALFGWQYIVPDCLELTEMGLRLVGLFGGPTKERADLNSIISLLRN
jgi:hypothetical protein